MDAENVQPNQSLASNAQQLQAVRAQVFKLLHRMNTKSQKSTFKFAEVWKEVVQDKKVSHAITSKQDFEDIIKSLEES